MKVWITKHALIGFYICAAIGLVFCRRRGTVTGGHDDGRDLCLGQQTRPDTTPWRMK